MKIAISSSNKDIGSGIYTKFERCNIFLIVDLDQNIVTPITNKAKESPHEIGGAIGHMITKYKIDAIITTDIGPSAFKIFKQNEIKVYQAEGIIEDAINKLRLGELSEITKATVPRYSYWKKNKITN